MQRLSRSLSRFETQDIKTQPQPNHYSLGLKPEAARNPKEINREIPGEPSMLQELFLRAHSYFLS